MTSLIGIEDDEAVAHDMTASLTIFAVTCAVAFPILAFYALILVVFAFNYRFQNTIYTLYIVHGVTDIFLWLTIQCLFRLPRIPEFGVYLAEYQTSPLLSFGFGLMMFLIYARAQVTLFVSLNRWTAITHPTNYKHLWEKTHRHSWLFVVFANATLFSSYMFFADVELIPINSNRTQFTTFVVSGFGKKYSSLNVSIFCFAIVIIALIFNSMTFFRVIRHRIAMKKDAKVKRQYRKMELSLFFFGIYHFIISIIFDVSQSYFHYRVVMRHDQEFMFQYLKHIPLHTDFMVLTSPFLFIYFCPQLRDFFCRSTGLGGQSTTTVNVPAASAAQGVSSELTIPDPRSRSRSIVRLS